MNVPSITLNDGRTIPQIGFGTFQVPPDNTANAVGLALKAGYRHVDTAAAYQNEAGVGEAVRGSGLDRDDVFVVSKLWNAFHGYDETLSAFDETMDALGLDKLDLYLIHWPLPMNDRYVDTWKAMVKLRGDGRIGSIGVSNFEEDHVRRLIDETGETPCLNQIELHPTFQQRAARDWHSELGIAIESWSPLGQGNAMENATLKEIAGKHGKDVGQVILRWHVDEGLIAIPRSQSEDHIRDNIDIWDFELDADDMKKIDGLDDSDARLGPDPREMSMTTMPGDR